MNATAFDNQRAVEIFNLSKTMLAWKANDLTRQNVEVLKETLHFSDWRYYVLDDPFLADVEYDQLFALLKEVESIHPEWITEDSPTHRVASGISEAWNTIAHKVPMLSLDNSYNAEDLKDWHQRCSQALEGVEIAYTVEPKYDGAGMSILFKDNSLTIGATRGNGAEGEEITKNIRQIKSIPLKAPISEIGLEEMEIRGEVLIPLSSFKVLNEERVKADLAPLANPRNAASGSLRMLDPKEVRKRQLKALSYHVSYTKPLEGKEINPLLNSHYETIQWMDTHGFATPFDTIRRFNNMDEVVAYCETFEASRDDLDYEVDGMVIKVDNVEQQRALGQTAHHPRWAMAYKFQARQGTSVLEHVTYQVGRTGAITPVAKIKPVGIGGVTVTSVSLFNEDNIRDKDLRIGDEILVERAGDVIPYIVKSFDELRDGSEEVVEFPTHCPECNEVLFKEIGEVAWRCINVACPAQLVEHLIHFSSKNAMDIKHLGNANIKRFYDLGLVDNGIIDIYNLDYEKIGALDKFGPRSVENLKKAVEASKNQVLHRLIFGLGIRFVGETTAKILAQSITHLLDLKSWSEEQLMTLDDVGPKVAHSVFGFFQRAENIQLIEQLEEVGVNVRQEETKIDASDLPLSDKTFVFTGALQTMKRKEAEEMVEALGAKILSNVSAQLDYLVVGERAGSKLTRAEQLGNIEIMEEQAFLEWIKTFPS